MTTDVNSTVKIAPGERAFRWGACDGENHWQEYFEDCSFPAGFKKLKNPSSLRKEECVAIIQHWRARVARKLDPVMFKKSFVSGSRKGDLPKPSQTRKSKDKANLYEDVDSEESETGDETQGKDNGQITWAGRSMKVKRTSKGSRGPPGRLVHKNVKNTGEGDDALDSQLLPNITRGSSLSPKKKAGSSKASTMLQIWPADMEARVPDIDKLVHSSHLPH